jgi:uncharacterized protein YyaL (SSP411 family)
VWSFDEIAGIAGDDADDAIRYWGVTGAGNFEGHNILHVVDPTQSPDETVERARSALFAHREQRVRPGRDDKVLLAWTALFLRSLAEAAAVLVRYNCLCGARSNAAFLDAEMRRADGRLLRSWQSERGAHLLAYAEDYAALLEAFVTLAETDDVGWLAHATHTADAMLDLFTTDANALLATTGRDAEPLIVRPTDVQDNATPAANSLAASGLLRLSALTGVTRYESAGEGIVRALAPVVAEHPGAFAYLMDAVRRAHDTSIEIAIVGAPRASDTSALRGEVWGRLLPGAVTLTAGPDQVDASPLLADHFMIDGRATAYVCENFSCRTPTTEPGELREQLDAAVAARRS